MRRILSERTHWKILNSLNELSRLTRWDSYSFSRKTVENMKTYGVWIEARWLRSHNTIISANKGCYGYFALPTTSGEVGRGASIPFEILPLRLKLYRRTRRLTKK